jgi:hypothetical protein
LAPSVMIISTCPPAAALCSQVSGSIIVVGLFLLLINASSMTLVKDALFGGTSCLPR